MGVMGVMGVMGAMRDGWARLPAGAIDKRNKKKTSEKKNIRKEKHQKRKTSEKKNIRKRKKPSVRTALYI